MRAPSRRALSYSEEPHATFGMLWHAAWEELGGTAHVLCAPPPATLSHVEPPTHRILRRAWLFWGVQASVNPKAETVEELLARRKNLHMGMLKLAREDLALALRTANDAFKVPYPHQ